MYENVFQRVEQKYLLNREQMEAFFDKIGSMLVKDKFYESNICNIYFG